MKSPFVLLCLLTSLSSAALAQQGGGGFPRAHGGGERQAAEHEPRHQREELRSLIREQRPQRPMQSAEQDDGRGRQLSREEREALREQLRQQRRESGRREP